MRYFWASSTLVLLLFGCSFAPEEQGDGIVDMPDAVVDHIDSVGGQVAGASRFAGTWVVDQPTHAAYEASFYDFQPGGALVFVGSSFDFYGPPDGEYHTGTVAVPDGDCSQGCEAVLFACTFDDQWAALAEDRLDIKTACDDGVDRHLELAFQEDATANSAGTAVVTIVRLDTFDNAVHNDWPWQFTKCLDPSGGSVSDHWACERLNEVE